LPSNGRGLVPHSTPCQHGAAQSSGAMIPVRAGAARATEVLCRHRHIDVQPLRWIAAAFPIDPQARCLLASIAG
jgi:hypothetical protein